MTKKQTNKKLIKNDWQKLIDLKDRLDIIIKEAQVDYKSVPEALILAQKFNNQIDYIEKEYGIPNEAIGKKDLMRIKEERDSLYQLLYVIFDKISNDDMVEYIKNSLDDRVAQYKIFTQDIEKSSDEYVLKMFNLRDEIKYLYDELDIWTGRWSKREDRIETCDITDKFCQEIGGLDIELRKFILTNEERFQFLKEEAKKNLVIKPDGSKRFDFWWWYILE